MRLTEDDMPLYGQHPLRDTVSLVPCLHCSNVIKESAFLHHMGVCVFSRLRWWLLSVLALRICPFPSNTFTRPLTSLLLKQSVPKPSGCSLLSP